MVSPCPCISCTGATWRAGIGYTVAEARAACIQPPPPHPAPTRAAQVPPPAPNHPAWVPARAAARAATPQQMCWPCTYIEHNHQYYHGYLPQAACPAAPAKAKEDVKTKAKAKPKVKAAAPPPHKPETVVSAASTQLSAASTAVASKTTSKHPSSANTPPNVGAGGNYMFPKEHTKLHIFNKAAKIWDAKYKGEKLNFKMFTVSTLFTPAMVIENTTGKSGDEAKVWAVTEVVEKGDGSWAKGSTIEYGTPKAQGTPASMGWTKRRGDSLPPVWLTVHKI